MSNANNPPQRPTRPDLSRLLIMGPPGAGKGTQASSIAFHRATDDWISTAAARPPIGKLGQVSEIAEFVVFLLSDRSGVVTGSVIDCDQNVLGSHD